MNYAGTFVADVSHSNVRFDFDSHSQGGNVDTVTFPNAHLLFWLSLVPFTTAWMAQHASAPWPVAAYGINLLLCAIAYYVLSHRLIAHHGKESPLAIAFGRDRKGKISLLIYIVSIPLAFYRPALSYACFIAVAIIWLVPDRRIERALRIE